MNVITLSVLGSVSYIISASEIFAATKSQSWLREKFFSIEGAGNYLLFRISPNGLLAGAGFYIESPPRNQWDGITQCYGIHCFRLLAAMHEHASDREHAREWRARADALARHFQAAFWRKDHYGEYVHAEHGLVD